MLREFPCRALPCNLIKMAVGFCQILFEVNRTSSSREILMKRQIIFSKTIQNIFIDMIFCSVFLHFHLQFTLKFRSIYSNLILSFFRKNHYAPVSQASWCNMTFTAAKLFPSHTCIGWSESSPHRDSNPGPQHERRMTYQLSYPSPNLILIGPLFSWILSDPVGCITFWLH